MSNEQKIKTTTITPELCECGRLYKDKRNSEGKMMCSACYSNCSVETLNKLWSTPIPEDVLNRFKTPDL